MRAKGARPSGEVLEASYIVISERVDAIIAAAGDVRMKLAAGTNAKDLRAPRGREAEGSAFMRPVVQKSVVRVICQIAAQGVLTWEEIIRRVSYLEWQIGSAPWLAVFNPTTKKMITAKENVELLDNLVYVHLAASSKEAIRRARKEYKDVRGSQYPFTEEQLQANLTPHTERREVVPEIAPSTETEQEEPSTETEEELRTDAAEIGDAAEAQS